jgi:hypothetical protein
MSDDDAQRLLDQFPQRSEEGGGDGSIDGPVIDGQVSAMVVPTVTWSPRTTGWRTASPMARMAACGGLITAVNCRMPYMPRLLTVKVLQESSSG